jgi:hypothetical protein
MVRQFRFIHKVFYHVIPLGISGILATMVGCSRPSRFSGIRITILGSKSFLQLPKYNFLRSNSRTIVLLLIFIALGGSKSIPLLSGKTPDLNISALDKLLDDCISDEPEKRAQALKELVAQAQPLKRPLLRLVRSGNGNESNSAAIVLGFIQEESVQKRLVELIQSKSPSIRAKAVAALGYPYNMKTPPYDLDLFFNLMTDDDLNVRLCAARALALVRYVSKWQSVYTEKSKEVRAAEPQNIKGTKNLIAYLNTFYAIVTDQTSTDSSFSQRLMQLLSDKQSPDIINNVLVIIYNLPVPASDILTPHLEKIDGIISGNPNISEYIKTNFGMFLLNHFTQEALKLLKNNDSFIKPCVVKLIDEGSDWFDFETLLDLAGDPLIQGLNDGTKANIPLIRHIEDWLQKISGLKPKDKGLKERLLAWGNWYKANKQALFRQRIDAAIAKGISYLKSQHYPVGLADELMIYTLLKCGLSLDDEIVSAGFKHLLKVKLSSTYNVSVLAMTLATALEKDPKKTDYYEKLKEAVDWLIKAQHPYTIQTQSKDADKQEPNIRKVISGIEPWAWRYNVDSKDFDNSCTQFALLGLRAAQNISNYKSGFNINIPKSVWEKALAYLISDQSTDGGWSYTGPQGSYGSMTAAGICGLIMCLSSLDTNRNTPELINGVKWLQEHWYLKDGRSPQSACIDYYWLYSMERACMLAGITTIGGHDWYYEGASLIVKEQKDNGSWSGSYGEIVDTCFALLFLKRAYIGVITSDGQSIHPIITPGPEDSHKPVDK